MTLDPVVDLTLRVSLALLFAAASRHKLRDFSAFRATMGEYQLLPAGLVAIGAAGIVAAELGIVVLLLAGPRRYGLVSAAMLLGVYGFAVAVNLVRGRQHIDCGCTAAAGRRPIGGWLVARNVVLAGAALVGAAPVHVRPLIWVDALTMVSALGGLVLLYQALDQLRDNTIAIARLRGTA